MQHLYAGHSGEMTRRDEEVQHMIGGTHHL